MTSYTKRAFTLLELIAVIIIVSVMAAMSLPSYTIAVQGGYESDTELNLKTIHAAESIYRAQNGGLYWEPVGAASVTVINTNLNLAIIENNVEYRCNGNGDGLNFTCIAYYPTFASPNWTITVDETPLQTDVNPCCSTLGACPNLADC